MAEPAAPAAPARAGRWPAARPRSCRPRSGRLRRSRSCSSRRSPCTWRSRCAELLRSRTRPTTRARRPRSSACVQLGRRFRPGTRGLLVGVVVPFALRVRRSACLAVASALPRAASACSSTNAPTCAPAQLPAASCMNACDRRRRDAVTPLESFPPLEQWDDWVEYDATAWPQQGREALHARADDLLQLRGGVRAGRVRRQDDAAQIRKLEGNPLPPRLARPQLRQGPGDAQPDRRPRAHPLSAEARRPARQRASSSARRGTRCSTTFAAQHPHGAASRAAAPRSCTTSAGPATTATWTACCRPGASTATTATPTSARRRRASATRCGAARSAVAGPREREVHPAALVAPRDRALLQPARAADHRRQDDGREARRHRRAPLEHGVDGRLLARAVAGHRGAAPARRWRT